MKELNKIPFNLPYVHTSSAIDFSQLLSNNHFSGDGFYSKKASQLLSKHLNSSGVLLTPSCTAALEMAVILSDVGPGDEVIVPSYTFVSTANAVVFSGGMPVFVDVDPVSLSVTVDTVKGAVTERTKAIIVVHYGGSSGDIASLAAFAKNQGLTLIEDAAQSIGASFKGQPLGTFGRFGCMSFHETKNIHCGEGGALIINESKDRLRAEIVREKGTNRSAFFRNEIDKYTWVDRGSSYLPSEFDACFLFGQLSELEEITSRRKAAWSYYYEKLHPYASNNFFTLSTPIEDHNAHIFYLLLHNETELGELVASFRENNILAVTHYVPLHSSPGGRKFGRFFHSLSVADSISSRLIRLPLFTDISRKEQDRVIEVIHKWSER